MAAKPRFDFEIDWTTDLLAQQPSRPIKHLPEGGAVVEITTRTIHGRFLMKPGTKANEAILGILGRALHVFPDVRLHAFWFLSNHYNLLAFFPDVFVMAAFMNHVNSNLARELGMLHDWPEKFFGRRYRGIVLVDPGAEVPRLAYLLAQGTKEGLVSRPFDWPGAKCLGALVDGDSITGKWLDRTALFRARKRNPNAREKDFYVHYPIDLEPLPTWEHLSDGERRARARALVDAIEKMAAEENQRRRRKPMNPEKILRQNPHDSPVRIARSPAPMCHASSKQRFWGYVEFYGTFLQAYRTASEAFRGGDLAALEQFPPGCFRPGFAPESVRAPRRSFAEATL